jgi:hypothetical protein
VHVELTASRFTWDTAGHSVTQTTFDNPCGGGGGFNAGIMTTSGATVSEFKP